MSDFGAESFAAMATLGQKICLSMIVKNEAPVIARCLASVAPLIDEWVIVDTGSEDGTQAVIAECMKSKPGRLYERAWVDFAHNRTEALELAKPRGHYTLIIDADDTMELSPGFRMPFLKLDSYTIDIVHKELRYPRAQLVRSSLPWRYEGVLHEFLTCGRDKRGQRIFSEARSQGPLAGAQIRMSDEGARRRRSDAERYSQDAELLESALAKGPDSFLTARYRFYLAQSYNDAGDKPKALMNYQERAKLGFWAQEVFISLYQSAVLRIELGFDPDEVIDTFVKAAAVDRRRAEALHGAARFCRVRERYNQGYEFAKRALKLKPPADALLGEPWVYEYGVLDEFAVNAFWVGRFDECAAACERLLREGKIPASERERVERNLRLARERGSARSKAETC